MVAIVDRHEQLRGKGIVLLWFIFPFMWFVHSFLSLAAQDCSGPSLPSSMILASNGARDEISPIGWQEAFGGLLRS